MSDQLPPTEKTPSRGTIILDIGLLHHLSVNRSPHLRSGLDSPITYLDTLRFLAGNGYRVLIPEIVSLIAGNVTAKGNVIQNMFDTKLKNHISYEIVKSFMREAALPSDSPLKNFPTIEIIPDTGPSKVDEYCSGINDIMLIKSEHYDHVKRVTSSYPGDRNYRRNMLIRLREKRISDGDEAIMSLIAKIPPTENVTVLSDKTALLVKVKKEFPQVSDMNSRDLLQGIVSAGLADFAGFAPGVTGQDLQKDFWNDSGVPLLTDHEISVIQSQPFYHSLQSLAGQLRQRAAAMVNVKPPAASGDGVRVTEFTRKFGKFLINSGEQTR